MKKLLHILFLSCLKATELVEKKLHFKLSIQEKIQLRLHKMMCEACTKYEKQSLLIEKGLASLQNGETGSFDTDSLKNRISVKLDSMNND
jgi:hypothetical protein